MQKKSPRCLAQELDDAFLQVRRDSVRGGKRSKYPKFDIRSFERKEDFIESFNEGEFVAWLRTADSVASFPGFFSFVRLACCCEHRKSVKSIGEAAAIVETKNILLYGVVSSLPPFVCQVELNTFLAENNAPKFMQSQRIEVIQEFVNKAPVALLVCVGRPMLIETVTEIQTFFVSGKGRKKLSSFCCRPVRAHIISP